MALLIAAMLISGFTMTWLNDSKPLKWFLYKHHESVGILTFLLLLYRIVIRLKSSSTYSMTMYSTWQNCAYIGIQFILYALMILMPISGYLQRSPYGVHLFQISIPVVRDQFVIAGYGLFYHHLFAKVFVGVIGVHILAYFYHKFYQNSLSNHSLQH